VARSRLNQQQNHRARRRGLKVRLIIPKCDSKFRGSVSSPSSRKVKSAAGWTGTGSSENPYALRLDGHQAYVIWPGNLEIPELTLEAWAEVEGGALRGAPLLKHPRLVPGRCEPRRFAVRRLARFIQIDELPEEERRCTLMGV
jgi:hypothetical protein